MVIDHDSHCLHPGCHRASAHLADDFPYPSDTFGDRILNNFMHLGARIKQIYMDYYKLILYITLELQ